MFQYVFTLVDVDIPFALFTTLPKREIFPSTDLMSSHALKECLIMVESVHDRDIDSFLDLIDEVHKVIL